VRVERREQTGLGGWDHYAGGGNHFTNPKGPSVFTARWRLADRREYRKTWDNTILVGGAASKGCPYVGPGKEPVVALLGTVGSCVVQ